MKGGNCQDFDEEERQGQQGGKKSNSLPIWGNEKTMNLNPLILTNIQSSQYFKVNLYQLKTYHEVIDEIYYQVSHLEPWEKGSRKTSGQTGMCGGVRGVGAGGIVSTAYCILYKLYTLRLTRKQVMGLVNHGDSPYIRGLGFMYIRYTQPPADLWDWMEPYLDDEEEIDVRAGGGQTTTIGGVVRHMLTKLEWHATLFPRIPVPIQKDLEKKMSERMNVKVTEPIHGLASSSTRQSGSRDDQYDNHRSDKDKRREDLNGDYNRGRDRPRDNDRFRDRERKDRKSRSHSRERKRDYSSRQDDRKSRRYDSRGHGDERSQRNFDDLLEREKHRIRKEKTTDGKEKSKRSRSRSRDRHYGSRSKSKDRGSKEKHRRSRSRSRDRDYKHRH